MHDSNELFHELSFYTLNHSGKEFIHQHCVDAFTTQNAGPRTKAIRLTFSLLGLYLYCEEAFTGKQVQDFHVKMTRRKMQWPEWILPKFRGQITINDVLKANAGFERDEMIKKWCWSVWEAFRMNKEEIVRIVGAYNSAKGA